MFFFMLGWHVLVWSLSCFFTHLYIFLSGYLSVHFWSQHEQFSWWAFPLPVELKDTGTHIGEWEDPHAAIGTNTFDNWDKYILQSRQIHFPLGRDTFEIWTNTFGNWDKYILQLGQIHFPFGRDTFEIWTNTFGNSAVCGAEEHKGTHQGGKIIKRRMSSEMRHIRK